MKEKLNLLKETLYDVCDHYTVSEDENARIGHKSQDSSFFGYKTHIGMTEGDIITAAVIACDEKDSILNYPLWWNKVERME